MENEKSYSDIKKEFYYRYSKYVVPFISRYENDRKWAFLRAISSALVLLLVGILLFINSNKSSNDLKGAISVIALGFIVYHFIKKRFENKLKERVMPVVCGCFPKLKWNDNYIYPNSNDYKISGLIPNFSSIRFDDCFSGEYKDVLFIIEENYAQIGTGKHRHTVFSGVIISINMNKNFKGNTVIRPDSIFHWTPSSNLHHTVLEDVKFEKKFDVFTDDDVEARYLITPSLMERLNTMKVAFSADEISAAFYENKFFIALHTNKDLFSIGSLTKNVCDKEQFFTMFEEILSIIKLIDHFKLNQKIGM